MFKPLGRIASGRRPDEIRVNRALRVAAGVRLLQPHGGLWVQGVAFAPYALPAYVVLIASGIEALTNLARLTLARRAALFLIVAAIVMQTIPPAMNEPHRKLDWRLVASTIWRHAHPDDLVQEVQHHVRIEDPLARPGREAVAGQVGQPAHRVQVQPVVMTSPAGADVCLSLEDATADARLLQQRGQRIRCNAARLLRQSTEEPRARWQRLVEWRHD